MTLIFLKYIKVSKEDKETHVAQFYYTFTPDPKMSGNTRVKVTKLDEDLESKGSYIVDKMANVKCTCPANYRASHRNKCKHLKWVDAWIADGADTGKMYDPIKNEFVNRFEV